MNQLSKKRLITLPTRESKDVSWTRILSFPTASFEGWRLGVKSPDYTIANALSWSIYTMLPIGHKPAGWEFSVRRREVEWLFGNNGALRKLATGTRRLDNKFDINRILKVTAEPGSDAIILTKQDNDKTVRGSGWNPDIAPRVEDELLLHKDDVKELVKAADVMFDAFSRVESLLNGNQLSLIATLYNHVTMNTKDDVLGLKMWKENEPIVREFKKIMTIPPEVDEYAIEAGKKRMLLTDPNERQAVGLIFDAIRESFYERFPEQVI